MDGKPHQGPYIEDEPGTPKKQPAVVEELGPTASHVSPSKELTKEEWAALGAEGDGVMDDPNRASPQGNTGTEGGISSKDKDWKDGQEQVPQPPKEAPPHPHGEQETLGENKETETQTRKAGAQGLEVS
jgi:hypothetical protein